MKKKDTYWEITLDCGHKRTVIVTDPIKEKDAIEAARQLGDCTICPILEAMKTAGKSD